MNKNPKCKVLKKVSFKTQAALTLIELVCLIAVLAIGIGLLLPALAKSGSHVRIRCASNLKQVGLAFRIWEGDNYERYPMAVYTNGSGGPLYSESSNQFRYFQIMSNELSNPQVLICPEDKKRTAATNFPADFNGSHVSYFVGLNATNEALPQTFLAGDSNITNGLPLNHGAMEVGGNRPAGWTPERHQGKGNIAMADGSVLQFDAQGLNAWIRQAGLTNHLLMPPP